MAEDLFLVAEKSPADVRAAINQINSSLEEAARLLWELKQNDNWRKIGKYETWADFIAGEIKRPVWKADLEVLEYGERRLAITNGLHIGTLAQARVLHAIKDESTKIKVLQEATDTQPLNPKTGRPYKQGPPSTHIEKIAQKYVKPILRDDDEEPEEEIKTSQTDKKSMLTSVQGYDTITVERTIGEVKTEPTVESVWSDVVKAQVFPQSPHTIFVEFRVDCPHCTNKFTAELGLQYMDLPADLYRKLINK